MNRFLVAASMLLGLAAFANESRADEARLLRFPTINRNRIVFSYAGDLYTTSAKGGVARKLSTHDGYEMFPRFSPDGKWIAFTGQYDGNTEVFLIPSTGGVPKRLTYSATLDRDFVHDRMGPNNVVMGWTPDGKRIVYRSKMREFNSFKGRLMTVGMDGETPEQIPLPRGGFCSYSPDGKKLAYNRIFREFRTWKRYRGGLADDVWIYDFATKKTEQLTQGDASDLFPMWSGNKIYFVSDREPSGRMNLYVRDLTGKEDKKLTNFEEFDVKFPSLGPDAIVFENGGYLYRFDLKTEKAAKIPVRIEEDRSGARPGFVSAQGQIGSYEIAPDGKRALFSARGDVFTVPAEKGVTRNLTKTPGVHDRDPVWSPNGKWIATISDASGENELVLLPQDGKGKLIQLTKGADTYYYRPLWSPDSKKLLWSDKKLRLRYIDVDEKKIVEVAQAKAWEITDYCWSPDSKLIAFAEPQTEGMTKVLLYSLADKKTIEVTDGWYDSASPAFSSDGKYLFFTSERDFQPTYSGTEWNHSYHNMARIYLVTLAKETPSPFKPKNDEVAVASDKDSKVDKDKEKDKKDDEKSKDEKKKDGDKKAEEKKVVVKLDADGIKDRIVRLNVRPAAYGNLASAGDKLYYLRVGPTPMDRTLAVYDLAKEKETELGKVSGYELSADRKKMLVKQKDVYGIIDAPSAPVEIKEKLDLAGLEVYLDRAAEWKQIFQESWRQMRDFFYDPTMHGVDWAKIRAKYEPLLAHVNHRADLTYVIGEMIGELNAGHTYVGGGDVPAPKRVQMGLLGAELRRDPKTRYFIVERILPGENWSTTLRSPLTEIGVDVKVGDYILAIDGTPTNKLADVYQGLANKAGKQVALTVNSKPEEKGSREVIVVPTADEHPLYYNAWVKGNIEKVSKATNGQVGYIHVPDMSSEGLNEFVKHYYPQVRKKALIIDVRGNGGGNVSPMIIERLRREIAMMQVARNAAPNPNPDGMHVGPKVLLLDEHSASDGDLVAYRFRKYKLGPIVGKRSWGGVVGIRGTLPLLDGGVLNRPEFAKYDAEGKEWIIEGHGVDPDIVVDNDPAKEFAGEDQQLNKGIEIALDKLKNEGKALPKPPAFPKK